MSPTGGARLCLELDRASTHTAGQRSRLMPPQLTVTELRSLPKVELHRHLECTLRLSTLRELAPQVGIEVPEDDAQLKKQLLVTEPMTDLNTVLKKFLATQKVLAS